MKIISRLIALAVTLSLGIFLTYLLTASSRAADEKLLSELLKVNEQYIQAFLAGDKETCEKLLADEFVDLEEGKNHHFTYFDLNHKRMSFNQRAKLLLLIGTPDKQMELAMVRPVRHTTRPTEYENAKLSRDADSTSISFETGQERQLVKFIWRDNRWQIISRDSSFK